MTCSLSRTARIVSQRIAKHREGPQFGVFGEPRVNVLELNLDLDAAHPLG